MRHCLWVALLVAATARAELPSPRLDRITPAGASAGSTVDVEIQGADLEGAKRLIADHPGIVATFVSDRKFKITIGNDVPEGTRDIWALGPWGLSSPRLFTVSRGMTEIVKSRDIHELAKAQEIAVNTVVNGLTDGNRQDFYRLKGRAGKRWVAEVRAQAIDSALDATLTITNASGKTLAFNSDHDGRDPLISFTPPADGDYVIVVADLAYAGGLPYRLIVTDRPRIENVFPRALQAGKPVELTALGWNLGPAARRAPSLMDGVPLDEYRETVTAPADIVARGLYRFIDHPSAHSVLPTAATAALTGYQVRLSPGGIPANPVPVLVTDQVVTLEQEPNNVPAQAQKIVLPAIVSGRLDQERDADWFEFTSPSDGEYMVDVYCERIGGRADPVAVVMDDKDSRIAELDDFGPRVNAFDGHIRDSQGAVRLAAKRVYRVMVQDRYRRGGPRQQYVLAVRSAAPDVHAMVIHHQNPGPGGTTIHRGGAQYLDLILQHTGGVTGPVQIVAESLPKGLHMAETSIVSDTRGAVVLWADADAPEFAGIIKLTALVATPQGELRREVRAYTRVEAQQNKASSRPMRELVVAVVAEKPPFALRFAKDTIEIEAGAKATVDVICDRPWSDFKGAVTVNGLTPPGPVKMSQVVVAEGKSAGTMTIEIQAGARPGNYTVTATGQAQVPLTKDPMKPKANTLVTLPSHPVTVVVKPKKK